MSARYRVLYCGYCGWVFGENAAGVAMKSECEFCHRGLSFAECNDPALVAEWFEEHRDLLAPEEDAQVVPTWVTNAITEKKMENQHRKITGYRDLHAEEIAIMNKIKALGEQAGQLVQDLKTARYASNGPKDEDGAFMVLADVQADQRWVAIAATDLQTGFMALTRSVAKPSTF